MRIERSGPQPQFCRIVLWRAASILVRRNCPICLPIATPDLGGRPRSHAGIGPNPTGAELSPVVTAGAVGGPPSGSRCQERSDPAIVVRDRPSDRPTVHLATLARTAPCSGAYVILVDDTFRVSSRNPSRSGARTLWHVRCALLSSIAPPGLRSADRAIEPGHRNRHPETSPS